MATENNKKSTCFSVIAFWEGVAMCNSEYKVGIYLRISKDDPRDGESGSIDNQRAILTQYAKDNGWSIHAEYVDDGWSGVSFQRPAFERMLQNAKESHINLIIVKDA